MVPQSRNSQPGAATQQILYLCRWTKQLQWWSCTECGLIGEKGRHAPAGRRKKTTSAAINTSITAILKGTDTQSLSVFIGQGDLALLFPARLSG